MITLLPSVDISGFVRSRNPLIIYYNPYHAPTRFESTIMHELAHVILEHPPEKVSIVHNELIREADKQKEAEADFLGSCLQIPRRGIIWARQRNMDKSAIATHFGASRQLVQWRLNSVK
jgi:Zn-dependent peptidase ImmA (M78 family)